MSPSLVGILISPAVNPAASVTIVAAQMGRTASAKPVASVETRNLRLVTAVRHVESETSPAAEHLSFKPRSMRYP